PAPILHPAAYLEIKIGKVVGGILIDSAILQPRSLSSLPLSHNHPITGPHEIRQNHPCSEHRIAKRYTKLSPKLEIGRPIWNLRPQNAKCNPHLTNVVPKCET